MGWGGLHLDHELPVLSLSCLPFGIILTARYLPEPSVPSSSDDLTKKLDRPFSSIVAVMAPIRGTGSTKISGLLPEEPASGAAAGASTASGRQGRPSRVSAAVALASFNWTDDAIVEVGEPRQARTVCLYLAKNSGPGYYVDDVMHMM